MSYHFNDSAKDAASHYRLENQWLTTSNDAINDRGILPLGLSLDTEVARMPMYMVWLEQSVSCPIIIEADTETEACDEALYLSPDELDWDVVEHHVFEIEKVSEEPR